MSTRTIAIQFSDSSGRTSVRQGINFFGATKQEWKVADLHGNYAVHVRVDFPRRPKPENKLLFWKHPDGRMSHNGEISSKDRAYGLELVDGQRQGLLVEGEKCADAARAVLPASWLVAATVCGAASVPEEGVMDRLALIPRWFLWPDADANGKGRQHMERIAAYMASKVNVRCVTWPDAPDGGDVADFLASHRRTELMALLHRAKARP